MQRSAKMQGFSAAHQKPDHQQMSQGSFHAAALAPLRYDDDNQDFKEKEFFDIAELERKAFITGGS